jgi:hypothetical protein
MKKPYSLKQLKQDFITNTDGTTSGTFDEIFSIIPKKNSTINQITTDMMGCETVIAEFHYYGDSGDTIIITYLENDNLYQ